MFAHSLEETFFAKCIECVLLEKSVARLIDLAEDLIDAVALCLELCNAPIVEVIVDLQPKVQSRAEALCSHKRPQVHLPLPLPRCRGHFVRHCVPHSAILRCSNDVFDPKHPRRRFHACFRSEHVRALCCLQVKRPGAPVAVLPVTGVAGLGLPKVHPPHSIQSNGLRFAVECAATFGTARWCVEVEL